MSSTALKLVPVVMRDARATRTGKLVFWALAVNHDDDTGGCNPPLGALASQIGCSRNAVIEGITSLEEAGYIKKKHRFKWNTKRRENISNSYTVLDIPKNPKKRGVVHFLKHPLSGVRRRWGVVHFLNGG